MRQLTLLVSSCALAALLSVACSSGGGGGGPTPTPTITVSGTVVAQGNSVEFALPLPGVVVLTSGHSPVVTGSGGRFTISGVTTPYDLTIIDSTNRKATVWRGLTRPDPTVSAATQLLAPVGNAGSVNPGGAGAAFASLSVHGDIQYPPFSVPAAGTFTVGVPRADTSALPAKVYAWTLVGAPAFGSSAVTITGTPQSGFSVTTTALAAGTPVTLAVGGLLAGATGSARLFYNDGGLATGINAATAAVTSNGTLSLTPPAFPGNTYDLKVLVYDASNNQQYGVVRGVTPGSLALTFHTVPTQALPASAATGVNTTTQFSWAAVDTGAVYRLTWFAGGQPTFQVVTTATSATIPDLSGQGLALPAATSYSWYVEAFGPFTSTDQAAGTALGAGATGSWFDDATGLRPFTSQ